jgi:hypothetical protein
MEMQNEFLGKTFTRLTVVDVVPVGLKALRLVCVCACGQAHPVYAKPHQLRTREKTSCGCWKRAVLGATTRTHGHANSRSTGYKSRAYGVWQAMRDRCSNPKRADYSRYGGRGITVCKRWEKFENFLADMGEPPVGLTLDRKDNNRGYSPGNCRWASRTQQTHNSTAMVYVTINGATKHLAEWQRELGVRQSTYYARLRRGWGVEAALTTPAN